MKKKKIGESLFSYLVATAVILFLWEIAALLINTPMLPTPKEAFQATWRLLQTKLALHLWVSTYRVVLSILISLLLALPIGLIIGFHQKLDRFLAPLIYIAYPIPKIVFLPLILIFFGLGDGSKIFLITFVVFFQILVTTRDAVRKIPREMIDSLYSLGAHPFQVYRYTLLPACLPDVLTALRLSMGTAIAILFFAESFATSEGLGYFIMDAWSRMAPDEMFAGIIMMGSLGVVLFVLIDVFENYFCRWQHLSK